MSRRRRSSFSVTNDQDDSFPLRGSINSRSGTGFESIEHTTTKQGPKNIISYTHLAFAVVLCVLPWIPSHLLGKKIENARQEAVRYQSKSDDLLRELNKAIDKRRDLKGHVDKLTKENNDLLTILKLHGDMVDPKNNLYRKAEEEEEMYMGRIKDIETAIQTVCRSQLKEKFGQEQKELTYKILLVNSSIRGSQTILIETLPVDFVPHGIAVFNDQLNNGLDGFEGSTLTTGAGDCLHVKASLDGGPSTSLSFVEQPLVPSMVGMNVLIGKRGSKPALLFCAGKSDSHEMDMESVFATVLEGSSFLERINSKAARSSDQNWSIHSIRLVADS